jgi:hypothetical protein
LKDSETDKFQKNSEVVLVVRSAIKHPYKTTSATWPIMSFYQLPVELQQEVVMYLDLESLQQFRLVDHLCKDMSLFTFKHNFKTVRSSYSEDGLQRLLGISKSTELSAIVLEIWVVINNHCGSDLDKGKDYVDPFGFHFCSFSSPRLHDHLMGAGLLALAISNFRNCKTFGTSTLDPQYRAILEDDSVKIANAGIQAFDISHKPLDELRVGAGDIFKPFHVSPAQKLTLSRLSVNINYCFSGDVDDLLSSVQIPSLSYLRIWAFRIMDFNLKQFWKQAFFPNLKEAELRFGNFSTRLSAVQMFIQRHTTTLQKLYATVQRHLQADCPSFEVFLRNECKLQELLIEIRPRVGEQPNWLDCNNPDDIRSIRDFAKR